jgi:hypothetical protein
LYFDRDELLALIEDFNKFNSEGLTIEDGVAEELFVATGG